MHAVLIHETGGPDVLRYEEADQPEVGDGEVLIRVHAASVNPVDWKYHHVGNFLLIPPIFRCHSEPEHRSRQLERSRV